MESRRPRPRAHAVRVQQRGALNSKACEERPEELQREQTAVSEVGLLGHMRRGDGEARQRPALLKSSRVSSKNATPHALVLQPTVIGPPLPRAYVKMTS